MCWRPHRLFGLVVPGGREVAVRAALQGSWSVFRWRKFVRRESFAMTRVRKAVFSAATGLLLFGALGLVAAPAAFAQSFTYNPRPPKPVTQRPANDGQMLVQANEV